MSEKLLPCPFCGPGNSCVDLWHDDVAKRWRVGCGACGCSTGTSPRDKTKAPAIAAWNRRTPAPEGEAACVIAFREGRREPEFISWNKMPVGEHRLYAALRPTDTGRE